MWKILWQSLLQEIVLKNTKLLLGSDILYPCLGSVVSPKGVTLYRDTTRLIDNSINSLFLGDTINIIGNTGNWLIIEYGDSSAYAYRINQINK